MRCPKNYRDLTAVERDRFAQALYQLKAPGVVDQFANDHDVLSFQKPILYGTMLKSTAKAVADGGFTL
jgi:hypothetical protein